MPYSSLHGRLGWVSGLLAVSLGAQQPVALLPPELAAVLAAEVADCHLDAVSIAVVDGGRIRWAGGHGQVSIGGNRRPADADTVYHVASLSKLVTATAVMQAVERGELDLDDAITEVTPEIRPRGHADQAITWRQLLTHTSGLVREPPVGHYFDLEPPDLAQVVESLGETELVAAPGEAYWKYSNAGPAWVGHALALHAGKSFEELVEAAVLAPLSMRGASFESGDRDDVVLGHMWTYDERAIPTPTVDLGLGPAANLCASMRDLARFAQSWFLGEWRQPDAVLGEASLQAMFTPQVGEFQGLAFFLDRFDGQLRVGHDGAYYGVATRIAALPELGLAVAVATPLDFAAGPLERITDYALRAARAARDGAKVEPPPARLPPVGRDRAAALAGYYGEGVAAVELLEYGGELWLRPRSGLWVRFRQDGDDASSLVGADRCTAWLPMRIDGDELQVGGRRLTRTAGAPIACPAELRGFLGEYGWDHDVLIVFERAGELAILIEWVAEYPLTRVDVGAGEFALDRRRGMYRGEAVEFELDAAGKPVAVRIGAVRFPRRPLRGVDDGGFRIEPRQPLERLRALAAAARAPRPEAGARPFDLVELRELDDSIRYDIRYATDDNFLGMQVYETATAKLQRPAAEALLAAHRGLAESGVGVLVHDAWRPWQVTKMFWDATPDAQRQFVANPQRGSRHNRGCAADLGLYELATGTPIEMPSGYDEFTARAYPCYPGGTGRQRWYRDRLRYAMQAAGFTVYEWEWWHFDHADWQKYPVK